MDKDYIREGIELADGWSYGAGDLVWNGQHPFELNGPMREMVLDSVAAQLTRQVDATNDYWVNVDNEGSYVNFISGHNVCVADAKCRTENTIKAIIDSGALAPTENKK